MIRPRVASKESGALKKLIINADDFGLDDQVNEGILACHREGVVTATSCLVNLPGFEESIASLVRYPDLDVGLHFNLTWGEPLCGPRVPRLAPDGRFRTKMGLARALALGRIPRDEIAAEAEAQLARLREALGSVSHVDVHQHFHGCRAVFDGLQAAVATARVPFLRRPLEPGASGLAARFLNRAFANRSWPASLRTTDHFLGLSTTGRPDRERYLRYLAEMKDGLTELMVHPGRPSPGGPYPDQLARARSDELEILLSVDFRRAVLTHGIELTNFRRMALATPTGKGYASPERT